MDRERFIKFFAYALPVITVFCSIWIIYQWQNSSTAVSNNPKDKLYKGVSDSSLEEFYKLSQKSPETKQGTSASFLAVGDIMLSRNVAGQIHKNNKDSLWPFRKLDKELLSTDFNFGNLESPFTGRDDFNPSGSLVFNSPMWTLPGLSQYNFKVLNLANNHAMDQGPEGLKYTKKLLSENGIKDLGVGENLDEAYQGQVYSAKGIRIGFLGASYASFNDGGQTQNDNVARIEDTKRLKESISKMKARSDFIVVTMHAGTEYSRKPNQSQIDFAHQAIDYGADLVIGAHPHWIQTGEVYKNKHIFYSLGNFIFDQMWSQDTKEGLMLKVTLSKDANCSPAPNSSPTKQQEVYCADSLQGSPAPVMLKQIQLIPVIIENYGQPRLANEEEKKKILTKSDFSQAEINFDLPTQQ